MDNKINESDFESVTELGGEPISGEQLDRLCNRYYWAASFCINKDVVECACGSGPGLGLIQSVSKTLEAGDYSGAILKMTRAYYKSRVNLLQFDACDMPFESKSKDVLILFEAIYYLTSPEKFVQECERVLRPGGMVLLVTANKDLPDFNPSPYSNQYLGANEMGRLFKNFDVNLFGYLDTEAVSLRQKLLRPIKRVVVKMGLMPKSMAGKRLLKRLVFGPPVNMPHEITSDLVKYLPPNPISLEHPDRRHKVLYCQAKLR